MHFNFSYNCLKLIYHFAKFRLSLFPVVRTEKKNKRFLQLLVELEVLWYNELWPRLVVGHQNLPILHVRSADPVSYYNFIKH